MIEQTKQIEVLGSIKLKQREQQVMIGLSVTQDGAVYIPDLFRKIGEIIDIDASTDIYYFDYAKNCMYNLKEQQQVFLPYQNIVCENSISLCIQVRMSDELLANPPAKIQASRGKRSPERHIFQVLQLVQTWRSLYTKGIFNQNGELEKINLDRAAITIGVPRKSLEDYHLLLRNGYFYDFNFKQNSRKKIGVLRNFIKEKKKSKEPQKFQKEKQKYKQKYEEEILQQIRKQMYEITVEQYEEQLFCVVKNNSSSDEAEVEHFLPQN